MSSTQLSREDLLAQLAKLTSELDVLRADARAASDNARLVHELQVHQIELELQNRELSEAQSALEESRNRYADLYDSAPIAYFTLDERGVVLDVNLTGARLLGRERAPMLGLPFSALVQMEDSSLFWDHLRRCVQTRQQVVSELSFSTATSGLLVAQLVSVPVCAQSPPPLKFRTALTDITQLKRAVAERNQALASEQLLRARLESLDRASMEASAALAAQASTEQVVAAIEFHARALTGAESARIELTDRAGPDLGQRDSPLAEGPVLRVPIDYAGKTLGTLHVAQKRDHALFDQADLSALEMLVERVASALEVVRLNQIEARERERLRLLEGAARELAGQLDGETVLAALYRVIRVVVPDFAELCALHLVQDGLLQRIFLLHRDEETLHGLLRTATRLELSLAETSPLLRQVLEQRTAVLVSGPPNESENQEVLRNLTAQLPAESMIIAPLVARGRLLGVMTFASIESAKRYERTQQRCAEELATRCALALDTADLIEELRSAVRSRDNLLAVVSHDLRSPLSAIYITAVDLSSSAPAEERRKSKGQAELIKRSASHMDHLIEDLLTTSALESQGFTLRQQAEEANGLVWEACQLSEPLLKAKSLHFEQELAPNLPGVYVDRHRILQVLANLIGNAIKFTPSGGSIRLHTSNAEGHVALSVSDTGPGIAPQHLTRVFERCWTGENNGKGLGLGLYIAKNIVEAHGGKMWVESERDAGASFWFTLPAQQSSTLQRHDNARPGM